MKFTHAVVTPPSHISNISPLVSSQCIENWLDQNPSCPECRLELHADDVEVIRQAPPSSPASALPEEAFQVSLSSGGGDDDNDVSSPTTSTTAAAQPPATSPSSNTRRGSGSSTASPGSYPDLFSTSRVYGPASGASNPRAEPSTQRELSPDVGRVRTAATTTMTATTPPRAHASGVTDTSPDTTEINTAINATTAPFARYFGGSSPITEGPASPTFSVVRFAGLSPEPGHQGDKPFGADAQTPDPAATPQPSSSRAPFACFFDSSPCSQSPLRGGTNTPQSSLPAGPYAWSLDSADFDRPADLGWSPYSPGSSGDAGDGHRFADLTELNTAINATANDSYALNSVAVAPFAHYFESFESPTSLIRFVGLSQEFDPQDVAPYRGVPEPATSSSMVPFRPPPGGAGPAPFARHLESPSYYSTSPLSTANMAHLPLSPDFLRTPSAAGREGFRGGITAPHSVSPYYPPVPFRRRQLPQPPQPQPQPQPHPQQPPHPHPQQQRQQHVGARRRPGEGDGRANQTYHGAMESMSPLRPSPGLVFAPSPGGGDDETPGYQAYHGAIEPMSPPRPPPPRLVFTPSPAVGRGTCSRTPARPALPVQSAPVESGRERGEATGLGSATSWVWPLSSASIWDNKAWPAIGGRVRIDSLDEVAQARHEGRERNNVRQGQEGMQQAMPPPIGGGGGR